METLLHELVRGLLEIEMHGSEKGCASRQLVRLPGVAPGHSPWRGDILLLNHSRKESKRAGSCVSLVAFRKDLPARAISTKNKHLLVIFSDPNPRFHGGSFGV